MDKKASVDVNVNVNVRPDDKIVVEPDVEEVMASVLGDEKTSDNALKALVSKEPEAGRVLYKTFGPSTVKGVKSEDFTANIVISSGEIDRDKEVVDPKGLVLSKPRRVPLVAGHTYGDLRKHIGDVPKIKVDGETVVAVPRWLVGMGNPEADWAWTLVQEGLAAFSIGFLPIDWATADLSDDKVMERVRTGKEPIRRYTKWELAEVSQVIVPSNRSAIQRMVEAGVVSKELAEPMIAKSKDEPMSEVAIKAFDAALAAWKVTQGQATEVDKGRHDDDCPEGQHMVDGECVPEDEKALAEIDEKNTGDPDNPTEDLWKVIEEGLADTKRETWKVGGSRGLPVSEDAWDAGLARGSLGDDLTQASVRARWKATHIVYDSAEPENKGSYKFPFAKLSGGRLRAVRRSLVAVRAVLAGGGGGVDLPKGVQSVVERFVSSYLGVPKGDVSVEEMVHSGIEALNIEEKIASGLREAKLESFVTQEQMKQTIKETIAQLVAHIDATVDKRIAMAQGKVDAFRE